MIWAEIRYYERININFILSHMNSQKYIELINDQLEE